MQAPHFWFNDRNKPGLKARLLSPLGALYARATARRVRQTGLQLNIPVICVGNINAGGTGKTPTAIAVIQHLQAQGMSPHIVSRGYGGTLSGPVKVVEGQHTARDVGDEPLLLSAFAPTWVSKSRADGGKSAQAAGADIIILDDGFQNPSLHKDLSIVVVDAAKGFGNGRVIPAGPLREPVKTGMQRADLLLSIGSNSAQKNFVEVWSDHITTPHLKGSLRPLQTGMNFEGLRVLAFAGIGHPEKFFSTLRAMRADIQRAEGLSDHQPLTETLIKRLETEANLLGAQLVTTEKDAVRLPDAFRQKVLTVPVRLELEDWAAFNASLGHILNQKHM
ncbi:tetraacyldisaccharide 4'-kinase [Cochlodiniinecator piscidefendens]|uniref:tetraacyldisaccharide 4'-kinase n=1 Tax=Cochlodiniinecator piscidefendens TaxID=2715756 RepID=UPI001408B513|nr:tetraacyldisaccharide 4'-kinase [Cochlodiniinecator piscidefendens]